MSKLLNFCKELGITEDSLPNKKNFVFNKENKEQFREQFIEPIRNDEELTCRVVSQYTQLKKIGYQYIGRCPFPDHADSKPSFTIRFVEEKHSYKFHCLGCGKCGDLFDLIEKLDRIEFNEALQHLWAIKIKLDPTAKIPVLKSQQKKKGSNKILRPIKGQAPVVSRKSSNPLYSGSKTLPEVEIKELRPKTCRFITEFCHKHLYSDDPTAKKALAYLIEERGLTDKTIRNQKIGFYQGVCSIPMVNHVLPDSFDGYVLFPIRETETSGVLGFIGRLVGENGQKDKYRFTKNYKKSENLYLMYEARDAIQDKGYVIIVEGVLDALLMHQNGSVNTVALLGCNISDKQITLIKKCLAGKSYEKCLTDVFISLDNDKAGMDGSKRIYEKLKKTNLVVGAAAILPLYKDQADWLNQRSRKKTLPPYTYKGKQYDGNLPFRPLYHDLYDHFKKRIDASLKTKHPIENFVDWNPKRFIELGLCSLLAQKDPDFYNKCKKIIEDCGNDTSTVSEETGQYTNEYIPRNETGHSEPQQGIQLH